MHKAIVCCSFFIVRRSINSLWAPLVPDAYVPRVGGVHPGHTLLKPKKRTLKSAAKYPKHGYDHLVYGNPDNLDVLYSNYIDKSLRSLHGTKKAHHKLRKGRLAGNKGIIKYTGAPLHPGHALIKPKVQTLKSAAIFPKKKVDHLVYGNRENFGITYNKTNKRVLYTGFRRMNDDTVDNILIEAIRNLRNRQEGQNNQENKRPPERERDVTSESSKEGNYGGEILNLRRAVIDKYKRDRRKDHVGIKRQDRYASEDSETKEDSDDDESSSGEYENNPGNQYTLHKNRYKQNWLWNHHMDGNHMNINPYGPPMNNVGPTGVDLFFGRKWWYFNQLISCGATVSLRKQLEHVVRRRLENQNNDIKTRRFFADAMAPSGSLLGVPSLPSHLPEAEPILPGHTLLRPTLGMLKSAVKFPHRDLENGAGVYGNIDSMGIKYDGLNERVLYTGFRRTPSDYILVLPPKTENERNPTFILGAPISMRSKHFYIDPQNDIEINENKLETQRALEVFFQKAREGLQKSQITRQSLKNMLRINEDDSNSADEDRPTLDDMGSESHSSVEDKKTWFANSKNAFTHVNINSNAPEHLQFLPLTDDLFDEIRNWWYYNQDDFEVFDDKELTKLTKPDKKDDESE